MFDIITPTSMSSISQAQVEDLLLDNHSHTIALSLLACYLIPVRIPIIAGKSKFKKKNLH